jgi:hypothetical protein
MGYLKEVKMAVADRFAVWERIGHHTYRSPARGKTYLMNEVNGKAQIWVFQRTPLYRMEKRQGN